MNRMHEDKEVVSQVYIDDNTLIVEKADKSVKDYPIAPTTETLSGILEGSDSISVDLNEAGTKLQVKVDEDVLNDIEGKLDAPSDEGSVGQVLTKTESGSEWKDGGGKKEHHIRLSNNTNSAVIYFTISNQRSARYTNSQELLTEIEEQGFSLGLSRGVKLMATGVWKVSSTEFDTVVGINANGNYFNVGRIGGSGITDDNLSGQIFIEDVVV